MTDATSRPRRVLLVETNEDGTVGGSYRALGDLCRHLDRTRFEPLVLLYQPGAVAGELEAAGASVRVWDDVRALERGFDGPQPVPRRLRGLFGAVRRRAQLLRSERVDLVHLNNSPGVGFADWLPAAWLAGVPCITHLRGHYGPSPSVLGRALQQRFDAVLAVSRWMGEAAAAVGIPPHRIRIVYDGVDGEALHAALRQPPERVRADLGLAQGDFVILLAGHLRPWKGQQVALEALRRLEGACRSRVRLLFAGASPPGESAHRAALEDTVRAGALGAAVRFLGERRDVPDLMRAADVVLHASTRPEPFGLVVVEAMALGRPVVASRRGGPSEIVAEGSGLLFDPERPEELAFLLTQLFEQPALRARLGAAGRARAQSFAVQRTVAAVERCYAGLLGLPRVDTPAQDGPKPSPPDETRGTIAGAP